MLTKFKDGSPQKNLETVCNCLELVWEMVASVLKLFGNCLHPFGHCFQFPQTSWQVFESLGEMSPDQFAIVWAQSAFHGAEAPGT